MSGFVLGGVLGTGGVLGDQELLGSESHSPFLLGGIQGVGGVLGETTFGTGNQFVGEWADGLGIADLSEISLLAGLGDAMQFADLLQHRHILHRQLSNDISLAAEARFSLIYRLVEKAGLSTPLLTRRDTTGHCTETVALRTMLRLLFTLLLDEKLELAAEATGFAERHSRLSEALQAEDSALVQSTINALLAHAITLHDHQSRWFEGVLAEALEIESATEALAFAVGRLLDGLTLEAAMAPVMVLTVNQMEKASLADHEQGSGLFQARQQEAVQFISLGFKIGGETYLGYILNTENTGVTQYQDYPFNSLARHGDSYLGAGSMGICRLDGDTDAGAQIAARLRTGVTDFDSPLRKKIHRAYLVLTASGQILFKTVNDEEVEDWYRLTPRSGPKHNERVKLGRGVKSAYWQFEVSNVEGSDFELESLEVVPIILSGRL
jgi:hypothetical protein